MKNLLNDSMKWYSPYQFSIFRILFGIYLLIHFAMLIPYSGELFSAAGMLPDPALNPTHRIFPNLLVVLSTPTQAGAFLAVLSVLSLLLATGTYRRTVAVILWYGWACLFNRNMLISNPSLPFVGWLLLACAIIPPGEPLSLRIGKASDRNENWSVPPVLYWGAWLLLALGYTISGLHKLGAPSWRDGTALLHVLQIPLARENILRELLLDLPTLVIQLMTWGSLALEVLFLPLCLWSRTRPLAWAGIVGMHLGILTVVNFADLTAGMLLVHVFTFDPRWLTPRKIAGEEPVVFYDGLCGLCDGAIQFLLSEDRNGIYRFAPLQGSTAQQTLGISGKEEFKTMILRRGDRTYYRSEAVLRIAQGMGGLWTFAAVFRLVPVVVRDRVYELVARNRYRWFGKLEACRLPTPAERARFLP